MRGTPHHVDHSASELGIIPAYAGNTMKLIEMLAVSRDHPRVCGEHARLKTGVRWMRGSSPRMRGTRQRSHHATQYSRIIPAYAGNTSRQCGFVGIPRDHPRVCGEHLRFSTRAHIRRGSSPRMRGTLTPSCWLTSISGDHPRVCGEHGLVDACRVHGLGSSPRMRGTHDNGDMVHAVPGIIPAYAGNTCTVHHRLRARGDHPRVCGEHTFVLSCQRSTVGSSPRMRGTLFTTPLARSSTGIIPAYAGNTMDKPAGLQQQRDHPRVCGEHRYFAMTLAPVSGSSPRMRGTPKRHVLR